MKKNIETLRFSGEKIIEVLPLQSGKIYILYSHKKVELFHTCLSIKNKNLFIIVQWLRSRNLLYFHLQVKITQLFTIVQWKKIEILLLYCDKEHRKYPYILTVVKVLEACNITH